MLDSHREEANSCKAGSLSAKRFRTNTVERISATCVLLMPTYPNIEVYLCLSSLHRAFAKRPRWNLTVLRSRNGAVSSRIAE